MTELETLLAMLTRACIRHETYSSAQRPELGLKNGTIIHVSGDDHACGNGGYSSDMLFSHDGLLLSQIVGVHSRVEPIDGVHRD